MVGARDSVRRRVGFIYGSASKTVACCFQNQFKVMFFWCFLLLFFYYFMVFEMGFYCIYRGGSCCVGLVVLLYAFVIVERVEM